MSVNIKKSTGLVRYDTISQQAINTYIDNRLNALELPTGFTVASVYNMPSSPKANTIYLVQNGVAK